jgi:deoxyribose-phosphate aldolase
MSAILSAQELANYLELTLYKTDAVRSDFEKLCAQAKTICAAAVSVPGSRVELVRELLEDTPIQVSAQVGFPFGNADTDVKRFEVETAVDQGAQEIEVVIAHGPLKEGDFKWLLREMRDVVESADERPVKFCLELSLLNVEETARAAQMAREAGAHAISTGTGLIAHQPTAESIKLLSGILGEDFSIKVVPDKLDLDYARLLLSVGASRFGMLVK